MRTNCCRHFAKGGTSHNPTPGADSTTELGSQVGQDQDPGSSLPPFVHPSSYLDQGAGAGEQPEGAVEAEWAHLEAIGAAAQLLPSEWKGVLEHGDPFPPGLPLVLFLPPLPWPGPAFL